MVPRSALVLDDSGRIGLRTLNADNVVAFNPVDLVGETSDGVWVTGLSGDVRLIVRGQGYVRAGQDVDAVPLSETGS